MKRRTSEQEQPSAPAIRFAGLVRVSTERQDQRGESLRTQQQQIKDAARQLGGVVTAWYGGQEHATAGWEKAEFGRLLQDAERRGRQWDAVMMRTPDRWSRDNEFNKKGLDIFRANGVRFFVLTAEYDLNNVTVKFYLGVSAEVGAYQADVSAMTSIQSRISRARSGMPAAGKLPWGREYKRSKDRRTGQWVVDEEKQRIIEDVARRYLKGESMAALAAEKSMNHSVLHKVITRQSGSTWVQEFACERVGVKPTKVETPVPPLLPDKTIRAIQAKVAANKTYLHGQTKNRYLLGRLILCEECGYAMFGQTNRNGHRYYRHAHTKRERSCNPDKSWVRADDIENAVLAELFHMFGNPAGVERAIEQAVPDLDAQRQSQERLAELDRLIAKEVDGRQKVLQQILRAGIPEAEAEKALLQSKEKQALLQGQRERLAALLVHAPTAAQVRETAKAVSSKFNKGILRARVRASARISLANSHLSRMSWADKRDLVQRVFAGQTLDGKRPGVYISWPAGRKGPVKYTIRGIIEAAGKLPMDEAVQRFLTDPEQVGADLQDRVTGAVTRYAKH